jgi:hypothetical protein
MASMKKDEVKTVLSGAARKVEDAFCLAAGKPTEIGMT